MTWVMFTGIPSVKRSQCTECYGPSILFKEFNLTDVCHPKVKFDLCLTLFRLRKMSYPGTHKLFYFLPIVPYGKTGEGWSPSDLNFQVTLCTLGKKSPLFTDGSVTSTCFICTCFTCTNLQYLTTTSYIFNSRRLGEYY